MTIVEAMRSFLQLEQLRSSFFEDKAQVYSEAVLAQLKLGREAQAFHTMERSRSRAFLDLLGTRVDLSRSRELIAAEMELKRRAAELRLSEASVEEEDGEIESQPREKTEIAGKAYNEFLAKVRKESKEQASLLTVEPLSLKQVQGLLDPGQALLEYFVTSEKILLWVVGRDKVATLTLRTNRKDLIAKVNALRKQVSELTSLGEYQNAAQELYGLLIQPALPYIAGTEVIIVPHDALHYLPFQALYSPQGKYLIEEYSVSYLSSASLMQFTQEKRKAKGDLSTVLAQGGRVLALGNPDLNDPKMSLQFAGIEAKEIKNLYPQSSIYLEKEATEENAKTFSPQNDMIHFASHAELNENDPLSSAVLLAKSDKEDGRLEVREIFGMDLRATLVVLSACETGLGKLSSGDELVGLTRAFIYAGTPSVVASLWKVDDSSTAHLMASFYKNLKMMTKVEALRQAQLNLIRGNINSDLLARRGIGGVGKLGETPSAQLPAPSSELHAPSSVTTSHPYFWAPFILVGEGK